MTGEDSRAGFEQRYAGEAPWDTGRPQRVFIAATNLVRSPVLDAGCGTGENALYFAARGHRVTGIDFVEEAIRRARRKAAERGLAAEFLVQDALTLGDRGERFATVIDCGLLHVFSDEDRREYIRRLSQVVEPGGRLLLLCMSDEEPGTHGPRRVSRQEVYNAFADGWEVESIEAVRGAVNPKVTEITFSEGGPKAWFGVVRRRSQLQ